MFEQTFLIFFLAIISSCNADFESDCSATSDSYYQDGICYVHGQYSTQTNLRYSCNTLNADGTLFNIHISERLANISKTIFNTASSIINGLPNIALISFNGYKLNVGDKFRIVGRFQPSTKFFQLHYRTLGSDYPLNLALNLTAHTIECFAKIGGVFLNYDNPTTDPTHIRNGEFDIELKITTNTYEFYFDDILVHTCAQNQSYKDITYVNGWSLGGGGEVVADVVTINGKIYGGMNFFWSDISHQNGKWVWTSTGLALPSNYPGWTSGHPVDEADQKCALIDGSTGSLLTANCGQYAMAVCQYTPLVANPRYRFSLDVHNKTVSASSFLAEFSTTSYIACLRKCGEVATCKSVSYNKDIGHCELYDIYSGLDIIDATGYDIYNKL